MVQTKNRFPTKTSRRISREESVPPFQGGEKGDCHGSGIATVRRVAATVVESLRRVAATAGELLCHARIPLHATQMKRISHKKKIVKFAHNKKNLGFVPTMGGIHLGHISLIKRSIKECSKTIVSIFVNKQQFNDKRDFIKYPRILKKDIYKLKKLKIDCLYLPAHKDIYPSGYNKKIKIIGVFY